jgi:hypothetical protein
VTTVVATAVTYLCPAHAKEMEAFENFGAAGPDQSLGTKTTTTAAAPVVLWQQTGSGIESGQQFTVPPNVTGWNEGWSYNCASFGQAGNFATNITGYGGAADTTDSGTNQLGMSGSGTNHYYDTGTFSIDVDSECSWTEEAVTVPG